MPDAGPDVSPEERLHELAAGWSSGSLSEPEQHELLKRLQSPEGPRDAQVVWAHLDTASELKSQLSPVLTDSVKLRIARAGSGRFVNEARRRLGMARPGLAPAADPPAAGGGGMRRALLGIGLGLVAVSAFLWLLLRPGASDQTVAQVIAVEGAPTLSGEPLAAGARVDPRSLVVPAGARVELAWHDGARAELEGPAMAVAQTGGIALQAGTGRFTSVRELRVGLPDRQLLLVPGVTVAVAVDGTHSTVGCVTGAVEVAGHALAADEAIADDAPFPWRHLAALPAAEAAGAWRADILVHWQDETGTVVLDLDADTAVRLKPGQLVLRQSGIDQPRSLAGAPMAEVHLQLVWRKPHLVVRCGGSELLAADLPALAPSLTATAARTVIDGFTGPAPPAKD